MENIPMYLEYAGYLTMGLVCIATVVVKITPTESDDEKLKQIFGKVHTVFSYLPTLGVNPKTKELIDWYKKNNG